MADSPGSPLSSHASSEFTEDVKTEDHESVDGLPDHLESHLMPPAKRRKIKRGSFDRRGSYQSTPLSQLDIPDEDEDISSDTSGEAPSSPVLMDKGYQGYMTDDDHSEQVTACKWRNCPVGDLGNMDALVQHIHDDHIGIRQKRYACEWEGCSRIDANHASGYALKAHMRSHTREKPFYCALPECDKSFTRSDALAKHMRTVHETEALRPSDPIPRGHSQANVKPQRLKLVVRPPDQAYGEATEVDDSATINSNTDIDPDSLAQVDYPPDVKFTEEELAMPTNELFRLLRRQVHWAEEENEEYERELEVLEVQRKQEWQKKELVLVNFVEAELATAVDAKQDFDKIFKLTEELLPKPMLPMEGSGTPWYREVLTE